MIGYPIDYGDNLDSVDERCLNNFKKGFTIGTLVFSATTLFTTVTSASDIGDHFSDGPKTSPKGNGRSCPAPTPKGPTPNMNVGGNVPTIDRGAYAGAGITICTIVLRTGSF